MVIDFTSMFKKSFFSLAFILLAVGILQSQTWEPDYLSNSSVKLYKTNNKLGLVRFCGEGKIDSIPAIYNYIYKYETKYGSLNYIGMKDSIWYQINFKQKPKQIPYKNYVGKGLFIENSGRNKQLYSIERGLLFTDTTNRFSKLLTNFYYKECDYDICYLEEYNSDLYCFPTPDFRFNNINSYCLANSEVITFRATKVKAKKNKAKQTKYGLCESYLYSEGAEILPYVYDTIICENQCVFAKKRSIYEVYNGLAKRLPDSETLPVVYYTGIINYTQKGKHGLMDYYGKPILECKYDKVWVDKLLFAQLGDSLFCYDENKLIHTIKISSHAKIQVSGEYNFQPIKIIDTSNNKSINLFFYNSLSNKVLDFSTYDSSYLYDVYKDEYYMCVKKNGKYGIINFENKQLVPFEYDEIGKSLIYNYWQDSITFHRIYKKGKIGYISNSLKEYLPAEFDATGLLNEESRIMPDMFILKKDKLWYMYDFKNKRLIQNGFDTIILSEKNKHYEYNTKKWITPIIASKNGVNFYIDSTGKKYFDFKQIKERINGEYVILEDSSLNTIPVNICPLATINSIETINTEHSYAMVYCLNRYFIINKYGEMSTGFEKMIEFYEPTLNLIFGGKSKSVKSDALYTYNGTEVGKLSKYNWAIHHEDNITHEHYFVFGDKKKKQGLMNSKGEEILKCEYYEILEIKDGKCEVKVTETSQASLINLMETKK